jgi:hypothetical protein
MESPIRALSEKEREEALSSSRGEVFRKEL